MVKIRTFPLAATFYGGGGSAASKDINVKLRWTNNENKSKNTVGSRNLEMVY